MSFIKHSENGISLKDRRGRRLVCLATQTCEYPSIGVILTFYAQSNPENQIDLPHTTSFYVKSYANVQRVQHVQI